MTYFISCMLYITNSHGLYVYVQIVLDMVFLYMYLKYIYFADILFDYNALHIAENLSYCMSCGYILAYGVLWIQSYMSIIQERLLAHTHVQGWEFTGKTESMFYRIILSVILCKGVILPSYTKSFPNLDSHR